MANSGQVIADALSKVDPSLHGYLCSKSAAYAKIRRARRKTGGRVKFIRKIEDLPEKYRVTLGLEPKMFFWRRINVPNGHGLIFTTEQNLRSLAASRIWYADGVFSVTEKTYLQMYVLLGNMLNDVEQKARPLLYCIMSHKNNALYKALFDFLKSYFDENGISLHTKYAKIDFEVAVKIAIEEIFEGRIQCNGCSFHLRQNLNRKASASNILAKPEGCKTVNRIYALAYLPIDRVAPMVKKMKKTYKGCSDSLSLLNWFERTYVERKSQFFGWWNQWPMVEELYPTTNNYAESFFSSLRRLLKTNQSGLLTLVKTIQRVI